MNGPRFDFCGACMWRHQQLESLCHCCDDGDQFEFDEEVEFEEEEAAA